MKWITGEHHVSISGQTGAGKTYLSNQIHRYLGTTDKAGEKRISVFLNTQHEPYVYGYKCRSWADVRNRLEEGWGRFGRCINFLPNSTTGEQEHEMLVDRLLESKTPAVLVTDEAHEIAGNSDQGTSLHRAAKRGRRWNLKNLVVSQRPSAVSKDVLTQCRYHVWVGRASEFESQYLKSYGFDFEQLATAKEHEITVVEGGRIIENYPEGIDA